MDHDQGVDVTISMDIHAKSVDMDMDMDGKFHIHGNPAPQYVTQDSHTIRRYLKSSCTVGYTVSE